jgi:hypothetical protein
MIFKQLILSFLIASQVLQGSIMENDMNNNTNPALIDIYLEALKEKESSNRYTIKHTPSQIEDFETGKMINVQALGAYGILDINFPIWAKELGYEDFDMSEDDWRDPVLQDAIAKYKVQEYFNRFGSWDLVSVAWFAGPEDAKELKNTGVLDMNQKDVNGASIEDYVAQMNNIITDKLQNMDVDISIDFPSTATVFEPQVQNINEPTGQEDYTQYAANILNAISKASSTGPRPDLLGQFKSQVPEQAGSFEGTKIKTDIRREEALDQVNQYAQTVEQAFQQYLDAVNNG